MRLKIRIKVFCALSPADYYHAFSVLHDTKGLCILNMALKRIMYPVQFSLQICKGFSVSCRCNTLHVFEYKHFRFISFEKVYVLLIKFVAGIFFHWSKHVICLSSANKRICLAWRTSDYQVQSSPSKQRIHFIENFRYRITGNLIVQNGVQHSLRNMFIEVGSGHLATQVLVVYFNISVCSQPMKCCTRLQCITRCRIHLNVSNRSISSLDKTFRQPASTGAQYCFSRSFLA